MKNRPVPDIQKPSDETISEEDASSLIQYDPSEDEFSGQEFEHEQLHIDEDPFSPAGLEPDDTIPVVDIVKNEHQLHSYMDHIEQRLLELEPQLRDTENKTADMMKSNATLLNKLYGKNTTCNAYKQIQYWRDRSMTSTTVSKKIDIFLDRVQKIINKIEKLKSSLDNNQEEPSAKRPKYS